MALASARGNTDAREGIGAAELGSVTTGDFTDGEASGRGWSGAAGFIGAAGVYVTGGELRRHGVGGGELRRRCRREVKGRWGPLDFGVSGAES